MDGNLRVLKTKKYILEEFFYEFKFRIHSLHTIKIDGKTCHIHLHVKINEYGGLSVEKSDRKELRIFLYWQENTLSIVAILCNNVFTGLLSGNYSSFISNFLPLLRPIAGDK